MIGPAELQQRIIAFHKRNPWSEAARFNAGTLVEGVGNSLGPRVFVVDCSTNERDTVHRGAGAAKWCKVFFGRKRLIREAKLEPHQKHLLHVLLDYLGRNEWTFPTQKRLALDVGVTVTRIQQVIDELRVLRVVDERAREKNRRYHEYRIDFGTLRTIQQERDEPHRQTKPASPVDVTPENKPASSTQPKPALPSHTKPAWYRKNQGKEPIEPSPSDDGDGWKEIQKQLRQEGVRAWREVVRCARENGCSTTGIQKLIDYFRLHRDAWESPAGALYHRVANATPDQRADDPATWLPMKPAFVRQHKATQQNAATKLLAELSHDDIRKDLEWAVEMKMLRPLALKQFNDDPDDYLKFQANQTTIAKVIAARDAAIGQRAPIAQPPPADSSEHKQKRTPHGNEASALRSAQSP